MSIDPRNPGTRNPGTRNPGTRNPGTRAAQGRAGDVAPLARQRVVVTRAEHQAADLLEAYRSAGAEVVALPLLEVVAPADPTPLIEAARRAGELDWVVFTSANAVAAFLDHLESWPRGLRTAVVGAATARALAARGRRADLIPERADAEGLAAALIGTLPPGANLLLPQAADARPALANALEAGGLAPRVVTAYDKRLPTAAPGRAAEIFARHPLGWVTFTSPRIARAFTEALGAAWLRRRAELRAVSVGPVTSAELRRLGVEPAAEASYPSPGDLVAATVGALFAGAQRR